MKRTGSFVNGTLFSITVGLVILGVIMVLSTSKIAYSKDITFNVYHYMGKQLMWFSLGLAGMCFVSALDYNIWERYARAILLLAILLLGIVLLPVFEDKNGARRWISLGFVGFQPSEFAKLAVIFYLAAVWADRKERLESFIKGVLFPMLLVGLVLFLIVIEPDHGTAFFIGVVVMTIWFVAGGKLAHMIPIFTGMVMAIVAAIYTKPNLFKRISAFLNPEEHKSDKYYQVWQSLIGFAHGGLWGQGLGEGLTQTPFSFTDFIFSTMGEELGFIKCSLVLIAFMLLILIGYGVAMRCRNPFGQLLAVGCTTAIGVQAALNVAVVTGSIPTTGISLPFISYGGSSLLVSMTMVGLLMSVAKDTFEDESPKSSRKRRDVT